MTMATKNEVFTRYLGEYLKAEKSRKTEILDIVCAVTGMHRKSAPRKFRALQMKGSARRGRRGRTEYYGPDVMAALKDVWEAGGEGCGRVAYPRVPAQRHPLLLVQGEQDRDLKSLTVGTEVDVEYDPATNKATYIFVY